MLPFPITDVINTVISANAFPSYMKFAEMKIIPQIAKFMGPTWGPPESCRPQMGPMLVPLTLLSGTYYHHSGGNCATAAKVYYWMQWMTGNWPEPYHWCYLYICIESFRLSSSHTYGVHFFTCEFLVDHIGHRLPLIKRKDHGLN